MKESKIITIANRKGGVGKTTATLHLGYALAELRYRVLLVDFDSQANLTKGLGVTDPSKLQTTITDPMWACMSDLELPDLREYINNSGELDFIPCNESLSALELQMVGAMQREFILRSVLEPLRPEYDYILIDSGPALGLLTVNALMASDSVLIVSTPESDSNEGMKLLIKSIQMVRRKMRHGLKVDGILMNMVMDRTLLTREAIEEARGMFGEAITIYESMIPRTSQFGRAKMEQTTIFKYAPKSKGAAAYHAFCNEFLGKEGNRLEQAANG